MFEAIFEGAPSGAEAAYDYLSEWRDIIYVILGDYKVDATTNFTTGVVSLDQEFLFQMLLPAFEGVGIDADLPAVLNAFGVDQTRLIAHDPAATKINEAKCNWPIVKISTRYALSSTDPASSRLSGSIS